jgi:hypothetical protein
MIVYQPLADLIAAVCARGVLAFVALLFAPWLIRLFGWLPEGSERPGRSDDE